MCRRYKNIAKYQWRNPLERIPRKHENGVDKIDEMFYGGRENKIFI